MISPARPDMLAAMGRLVLSLVLGLVLGLVLSLVLAGCSSRASTVDAANSDGAGPGTPALAVASAAFAEGGTIPVVDTCSDANSSPPLAWTGVPSGSQSFAV